MSEKPNGFEGFLDSAVKLQAQRKGVSEARDTAVAVHLAGGPEIKKESEQEEKAKRIARLSELLVRGVFTVQVRRELQVQWGVTSDTMRKLVKMAHHELRAAGSDEREDTRATLQMAAESLYSLSASDPDPKAQANAIKALELLAKLTGSLAPTEHVVRPVSREEALAELREAAAQDPELAMALQAHGVQVTDEQVANDPVANDQGGAPVPPTPPR